MSIIFEVMYLVAKYPKVRRIGHIQTKGILDDPSDFVVIQEKVDGSNFRFWLEDGEIRFGSRRVDYIDEKNYEEWARAIEYIKSKVNPEDLREDFVYVGEFIRPHTVQYDFDSAPPFVGFDILNRWTGDVVHYLVSYAEFDSLGLPFVNTYFVGEAGFITDVLIEELKKKESAYGAEMQEGVVLKNYSRNIFAKSVNPEFLEDFKKKFGGPPKKLCVEEKIVSRFVTPARVKKIIMRIHEEQGSVTTEDIPEILRGVSNDILEEEILTIVNEMKVKQLDFKLLRKYVSKKVVKLLHEEFDLL